MNGEMAQNKPPARKPAPRGKADNKPVSAGAAAPARRPAADLQALRSEVDQLKRELIAANRRVRDLDAKRVEALARIEAMIQAITEALDQ